MYRGCDGLLLQFGGWVEEAESTFSKNKIETLDHVHSIKRSTNEQSRSSTYETQTKDSNHSHPRFAINLVNGIKFTMDNELRNHSMLVLNNPDLDNKAWNFVICSLYIHTI